MYASDSYIGNFPRSPTTIISINPSTSLRCGSSMLPSKGILQTRQKSYSDISLTSSYKWNSTEGGDLLAWKWKFCTKILVSKRYCPCWSWRKLWGLHSQPNNKNLHKSRLLSRTHHKAIHKAEPPQCEGDYIWASYSLHFAYPSSFGSKSHSTISSAFSFSEKFLKNLVTRNKSEPNSTRLIATTPTSA